MHGVAATSDSSEDTEAEALERAESQAKAKDMKVHSVQQTSKRTLLQQTQSKHCIERRCGRFERMEYEIGKSVLLQSAAKSVD